MISASNADVLVGRNFGPGLDSTATTGMGDRLRAGIPSRAVTSQLGQLSLASLRGRLIEYQLRLGKSGNVTSARWQVILCDPIWNVSSRSGEASRELLYSVYFTYFTLQPGLILQSPQHLDAVVPSSPNPGPTTQPQPAIDHYDAVSTFHDNNIRETRFSMLCTSCLVQLTTENCSQ